MDRWVGKVAVVTGAEGGIGSAIVKEFIKNRMTVIGIDYNQQNFQEFAEEKKKQIKDGYYSVQADLTNEDDILKTFKWIEQDIGPVSILINNAGIMVESSLLAASFQEMNRIFQINVIAPIICAKEALNSMFKHNIDDGHIINMCSNASRWPAMPDQVPVSYSATKHALAVISDGLHKELQSRGSFVKVTNLCPGWVNTDMGKINTSSAKLQPQHIAEACISILQTPPNVSITELIIKTTI